ncbi:uncharacterized protein EI97DRAFT_455831 [Westerdykella ornata]|uniref:Uncharacterized protein n=1 Tax=Westerdykella ornata TaxID=318751 RepID=A0A6A6JX20_WESOR|nr:uncharacterized protein EI97DRAFT_455831 [Westerdykella ornata]KAF2279609.1 hypothetical protein EI97DRAFT_455831 [Westerdykella ornata]
MDDYEEAVLFTITLLESRLDRLEYVLSGANQQDEEKPRTLQERVKRIERLLQELSAKTALLNEVRELTSKHSGLLRDSKATNDRNDAGLSVQEKAALVLERAPAFATTASQLKALDDQRIPETEGFTKLVKLRPRIAEAEARHLQQALEISLLRRRNGLLCSKIKHIHLLGQGRCWVEWHKRLVNAERTVTRTEFKHKQLEEEG